VLDEAKAILEVKDIYPDLVLDFLDTFENIQIAEIGELKDNEIRRVMDVVIDEKDRPIFIFVRRLIQKNESVYLVTGMEKYIK
jgi:hypothetical protein